MGCELFADILRVWSTGSLGSPPLPGRAIDPFLSFKAVWFELGTRTWECGHMHS